MNHKQKVKKIELSETDKKYLDIQEENEKKALLNFYAIHPDEFKKPSSFTYNQIKKKSKTVKF